jgi:adenylylsulfate kinase
MYSNKPLSIWFIGLPCSGKSTLSQGVSSFLTQQGTKCKVLDGDELRKGINSNLGFSLNDRNENIRRVAEINKLFLEERYIVLNALICPLQDMRKLVRSIVGEQRFIEIYVNAPLDVCEERDVKGMYKKARNGEILNFTGINSPFEPPAKPDFTVSTHQFNVEDSVGATFNFVKSLIMPAK